MAVFFIYVPDGGTFSLDDMEFSPNAEVVRRQLASRVKTGLGKSYLVSKMEELNRKAAYDSSAEEEWPAATDDAHMVVWRCKAKDKPSGPPGEVWRFSGSVDKPIITFVSEESVTVPEPRTPEVVEEKEYTGKDQARIQALITSILNKPDEVKRKPAKAEPRPGEYEAFGEIKSLEEWLADDRLRVSADTVTRRLKMGWDFERAIGQNFTPRHPVSKTRTDPQEDVENVPKRARGRVEVFHAFGLTKSIAEWSDRTGIGVNALRIGAKKHGMEEYLKMKNWHPSRRS